MSHFIYAQQLDFACLFVFDMRMIIIMYRYEEYH